MQKLVKMVELEQPDEEEVEWEQLEIKKQPKEGEKMKQR